MTTLWAPTAESTNAYLPQPATVLSRTVLTATEMLLELALDSGQALNHRPGQFVEVTAPGVGEAPISLASAPDHRDPRNPRNPRGLRGSFELVVRRAGRVTTALHNARSGQKLGIRGPFGTPFPVEEAMKGRDPVFIAGGLGLAPLRSAIQWVLDRRPEYGRVTILYGAKSPAERLFLDELDEWSRRPDVCFLETVDRADMGWRGHVGVITTLMPTAGLDPSRAVVAICGPPIMYKFVLVSLAAAGIGSQQIYLSLERRMKCGIGKCGHCQINGRYACLDGPVFNYADVVGLPEAIG